MALHVFWPNRSCGLDRNESDTRGIGIEAATAVELRNKVRRKQRLRTSFVRCYCKQVCKELTVEEEAGGNIVNRKVRFIVYSVMGWFDDPGVYHELILFRSDLDWLSEIHISVEDPDG